VYQWASRYTAGDTAAAEDLTHDVFLRLFERLPELDTDDIGSWLYRVTAHRALSLLRTRRVWMTKILAVLMNGGSASAGDGVLEAREGARQAIAALAKLPPQERAVACMRFLDDKSQHEIAKILDLSEGYVSKLLARAVARLRGSGLGVAE